MDKKSEIRLKLELKIEIYASRSTPTDRTNDLQRNKCSLTVLLKDTPTRIIIHRQRDSNPRSLGHKSETLRLNQSGLHIVLYILCIYTYYWISSFSYQSLFYMISDALCALFRNEDAISEQIDQALIYEIL